MFLTIKFNILSNVFGNFNDTFEGRNKKDVSVVVQYNPYLASVEEKFGKFRPIQRPNNSENLSKMSTCSDSMIFLSGNDFSR